MNTGFTEKEIHDAVKERYGAHARGETVPGSIPLIDKEGRMKPEAVGYSAEDTAAVPETAETGLSCGAPLAYLKLFEGDVVVDLGSGGGMDCILASQRVGASGHVYGIDMTGEMLELAERNSLEAGCGNITYIDSEIEDIPLEDECADFVISNCVLNLVPDKARAFRESCRILRPGGQFCFSDIVTTKPVSAKMKASMAAHTACAAGAIPITEYVEMLTAAGFSDIEIVNSRDWPFYNGFASIQIRGVKR